jgi:hypothetical protein
MIFSSAGLAEIAIALSPVERAAACPSGHASTSFRHCGARIT